MNRLGSGPDGNRATNNTFQQSHCTSNSACSQRQNVLFEFVQYSGLLDFVPIGEVMSFVIAFSLLAVLL